MSTDFSKARTRFYIRGIALYIDLRDDDASEVSWWRRALLDKIIVRVD